METQEYHLLSKDDSSQIVKTLTECFLQDPLYIELIPKELRRVKILHDVFSCDVEEMFNYCDMLADSKEVNGLMILADDTERRSPFRRRWAEMFYAMKTDMMLVKDDLSLKTLMRFILGHKYLVSKWTSKIKAKKQLHIIYYAVKKEMHGKGVAHKLIKPVLEYADNNDVVITLETHNEENLRMYKHYGFAIFETLTSHYALTQYCLVRYPCCGKIIVPLPPLPATEQENNDLQNSI